MSWEPGATIAIGRRTLRVLGVRDGALLGDALRGVRAFAADELTADEAQTVVFLIAAVDTTIVG